jgi:hypothetical protein
VCGKTAKGDDVTTVTSANKDPAGSGKDYEYQTCPHCGVNLRTGEDMWTVPECWEDDKGN